MPLALMVKKKEIVRFEGLPEFKWSDLGEQMWLDKDCSWRFLVQSMLKTWTRIQASQLL